MTGQSTEEPVDKAGRGAFLLPAYAGIYIGNIEDALKRFYKSMIKTITLIF